MKKKLLKAIMLAAAGAILGVLLWTFVPRIYDSLRVRFLYAFVIPSGEEAWSESFEKVFISSTQDGSEEPAFWYEAEGDSPQPLVLSLPTWGGHFHEKDELSSKVASRNWNYLRPNLRGPNSRKESCLSPLVLADIDDAIQFALDQGSVDASRIFIVGESGGGHAALGAWLQSRHSIHSVLAWVPITDLEAWYWQCKDRGLHYADDILQATSGGAGELNAEEARLRSPLFMPMRPDRKPARLEMYAGVRDGYGNQSVPISHSIRFFNRLAEEFDLPGAAVTTNEALDLLSRTVDRSKASEKIGKRDVLFERELPGVQLSVFDGGHEMLDAYCFERLIELSKEN